MPFTDLTPQTVSWAIVGLTLGLSLAAPAVATEHNTPPSNSQNCNENGYILSVAGRTYYLGKSCDAFSKGLGNGAWCWANGGLNMEFAGKATGFGGLELTCQHPALDDLACGCHTDPLPSWSN
jgi:hypothetical protein